MDSNARKRLRRSKDGEDSEVQEQQQAPAIDDRLFETTLPKHLEAKFATAIFEIGLKHSSPKILMPLMPTYPHLSTEHIKSHLQKYRIHRQRSKDEFLEFYNAFMKESYQQWEENKGWKQSGSENSLQGYYGGPADAHTTTHDNSATFHESYDAERYVSAPYILPFQQQAPVSGHSEVVPYVQNDQDSGHGSGSASQYMQHPQGSHNARMIAEDRDRVNSAYAAQIYRETEALLLSAQELCSEAAAGTTGTGVGTGEKRKTALGTDIR